MDPVEPEHALADDARPLLEAPAEAPVLYMLIHGHISSSFIIHTVCYMRYAIYNILSIYYILTLYTRHYILDPILFTIYYILHTIYH